MQSALNQTWQMSATPAERERGGALAQALGLPEIIGCILASRQPHLVEGDGDNQIDAEAAYKFLQPKLAHLPDPTHLLGLPQALPRLHQALNNNEKIAIFGDYDVDGACSSALLLRYFRTMGLAPELYIPDRLTEGYGPNPQAMETLSAKGVILVITVDCGSTATEALARAQELGMDVIVTDHHQCPPVLPPAVAVINPNRVDQPDDTPTTMLCGAGVAFYLLLALNRYLRAENYFSHSEKEPQKEPQKEPDLRNWLDLVATATIADMVPLTGANRPLLALGLQVLNQQKNTGIRALCHVTETVDIDASAVGFRLGPRINAAGRLSESTHGATLLSTDDEAEAMALAVKLDKLNVTRQEVQEQVQQEALKLAEAQKDNAAIVVAGEGWHPGVIGIVAARVKDAFYRPTFVLSIGTDGTATGSGRSVSGVNLGEMVHAAHKHVLRGGGHAMAAGVTLKSGNIGAFTNQLTASCQHIAAELPHVFVPKIKIDAALTPQAISLDLLNILQTLAPYGSQNREPVFAVTGFLNHIRPVGQNKNHAKLKLTGLNGASVEGISFGAYETDLGQFLQVHQGQKITLVGKIKPNTYNGITRIDLHVMDACTGDWQG